MLQDIVVSRSKSFTPSTYNKKKSSSELIQRCYSIQLEEEQQLLSKFDKSCILESEEEFPFEDFEQEEIDEEMLNRLKFAVQSFEPVYNSVEQTQVLEDTNESFEQECLQQAFGRRKNAFAL